MIQAQRAAYQAAELQAAQARAKAEAEKIDKDELLRKLNMKKWYIHFLILFFLNILNKPGEL